jgi:hypothetical protein
VVDIEEDRNAAKLIGAQVAATGEAVYDLLEASHKLDEQVDLWLSTHQDGRSPMVCAVWLEKQLRSMHVDLLQLSELFLKWRTHMIDSES